MRKKILYNLSPNYTRPYKKKVFKIQIIPKLLHRKTLELQNFREQKCKIYKPINKKNIADI